MSEREELGIENKWKNNIEKEKCCYCAINIRSDTWNDSASSIQIGNLPIWRATACVS